MEAGPSLSKTQLIERDSSDEDMEFDPSPNFHTDAEYLFVSLAQDWLDNNASQILKSLIQPKPVAAAGRKPKLARTAASNNL